MGRAVGNRVGSGTGVVVARAAGAEVGDGAGARVGVGVGGTVVAASVVGTMVGSGVGVASSPQATTRTSIEATNATQSIRDFIASLEADLSSVTVILLTDADITKRSERAEVICVPLN